MTKSKWEIYDSSVHPGDKMATPKKPHRDSRKIDYLRWWPLNKPLPRGWELAQNAKVESKHNHFQVLIRRKK